jgi:hypothetical protein
LSGEEVGTRRLGHIYRILVVRISLVDGVAGLETELALRLFDLVVVCVFVECLRGGEGSTGAECDILWLEVLDVADLDVVELV